jgi:hypothetical protein
MPRRKLTIDEALQALKDHGLDVEVKSVKPVIPVEKKKHPAFTKPTRAGANGLVKITLYAKHSIGSGGHMVIKDGQQQVENAGVQTYGPGVVTVSSDLAQHLLYQDMLSKQADERLLEKEQRCYVVAQRRNADGHVVNASIRVDDSFFNGSIDIEKMMRIGAVV